MQTIHGIPREILLQTAEKVLAAFLSLKENPRPEATGAFLYLCEKSDGKPLLLAEIGDCPRDKAVSCFQLAQEKAARLRSHIEEGQISSWQSRDRSRQKYGGAVTAQDPSSPGSKLVISVSGLPEEGDEALDLLICQELGWMKSEDVQAVLAISGNSLYGPLAGAMRP